MNADLAIDENLVTRSVATIRASSAEQPSTALILGSGLGGFAQLLNDPASIQTKDISGYPRSTVPGHAGWIHIGHLSSGGRRSRPVLIFQGRIHPYETGSFSQSSMNVRIAAALGASRLIITNAAGGIRHGLMPGSLMVHDDIMTIPLRHRSTSKTSQKNLLSSLHSATYDGRLIHSIRYAANALGILIESGTYCYLSGPSYETPAEIQALRFIGADAVGMSTYPEVMAAREAALPVSAISLISNLGAGMTDDPLSHEDVTRVAQEAGESLSRLLIETILHIDGQ